MVDTLEVITASTRETERAGETFGKWLQKPIVICLFGELGAGKTTFIKGLARGLRSRTKTVKSPTFVYATSYPLLTHPSGARKLLHMDFYRLPEDGAAAAPEDLLETLRNGNGDFIAIEWAERISDFLPRERIEIDFSFVDERTRTIRITRKTA